MFSGIKGGWWLAVFLLPRPGIAQEPVTGPLPDSLVQDAGMVKRMDATEIDIESPRKARIHHRYVYDIKPKGGVLVAGVRLLR